MFYYLIFYLLLVLFITAKMTMSTPQGKPRMWCGSLRKHAALPRILHTSHWSLSFIAEINILLIRHPYHEPEIIFHKTFFMSKHVSNKLHLNTARILYAQI
jgi:hypothetical protein